MEEIKKNDAGLEREEKDTDRPTQTCRRTDRQTCRRRDRHETDIGIKAISQTETDKDRHSLTDRQRKKERKKERKGTAKEKMNERKLVM